MSHLLDSLCGQQRLAECARNDAAEFTEDQLLAGDVERLARQQQRQREALHITIELELEAARRQGWL